VVVGIGINVAWPGPPGVGGTCLDDVGGKAQPIDKNDLLENLLNALEARRPLLDAAEGRRTLADELRLRCATLGQQVKVELPDGEITGLAAGIDDEGHLVVETAKGLRTISAGDIVHLRPDEA
jgi:BirA family biotin operon repressor/biotin-[acetyl-CoA-carboxylase] ligase